MLGTNLMVIFEITKWITLDVIYVGTFIVLLIYAIAYAILHGNFNKILASFDDLAKKMAKQNEESRKKIDEIKKKK